MQTNSRYIFISHGNSTNGAELCLIETVKALKLQGCNEVFVLLKKGGIYMERLLTANGAIIKHVGSNPRWVDNRLTWRQKLRWIKSTFSILRQFIKIFKELRPDFVISNTVVCNPASAIAAKIHGCSHVWYIHELGDKDHGYHYYFGKRFSWFLIKLLSDKIIFNSQFTLRHFLKSRSQKHEKFRVIYYAVSIDRFKKFDGHFDMAASKKWRGLETWKILVSGRTVRGKGQEDVINALGVVKNTYHVENFHLSMVGKVEGPYYDELCNLITAHDLAEHVSFVPFTENPADYYRDAHIGITTSRNEAFGRITVEYMKSNMVAIGANAGGTCEIIQNNVNGYLYELGNINQFAQILIKVMSDSNNSKEFAQQARAGIEHRFNFIKHGSEVKDFLQQ